jgi:uncharacterized protein (DUF2252 family)
MKPVQYLTLDDLRDKGLNRNKIPFLKRYAFRDENEVRLLWESKIENRQSLPVRISLEAISRITLSPWIHPSLVEDVKNILKSIEGCGGLKIYRSTLINNADWIKYGNEAT